MDIFDEELANEEEEEEALWNQHHAPATITGDEPGQILPGSSGLQTRYTCDECGETFFSIVQLAKHRQFHDRDRPYECTICGKRFLSRSHHFEHQRVHTGERPFPCDRCERSFTTHHNLKRHMTIHEKEEMYRCQQCGVLFCQEHEYKMENLRLPGSAVSALANEEGAPPPPPQPTMPSPLPTHMPVRYEPVELEHMIEEDDDAPSSSGPMTRIEQILMARKKKKKQQKKRQQSMVDVSKNIGAVPHYFPPKKKQKEEPEYIDHPVHEFRRRALKKLHSTQRIAYDIEVVL